jgi:uncharacterized membrane protein
MISTITTLAGGPGPGHGTGWDGPGAWWPVFPIMWFLLLAGAVLFAVLYSRRATRTGPAAAAEARLADRFASGEIGEQEYHERLAVLRDRRRPGKQDQ